MIVDLGLLVGENAWADVLNYRLWSGLVVGIGIEDEGVFLFKSRATTCVVLLG